MDLREKLNSKELQATQKLLTQVVFRDGRGRPSYNTAKIVTRIIKDYCHTAVHYQKEALKQKEKQSAEAGVKITKNTIKDDLSAEKTLRELKNYFKCIVTYGDGFTPRTSLYKNGNTFAGLNCFGVASMAMSLLIVGFDFRKIQLMMSVEHSSLMINLDNGKSYIFDPTYGTLRRSYGKISWKNKQYGYYKALKKDRAEYRNYIVYSIQTGILEGILKTADFIRRVSYDNIPKDIWDIRLYQSLVENSRKRFGVDVFDHDWGRIREKLFPGIDVLPDNEKANWLVELEENDTDRRQGRLHRQFSETVSEFVCRLCDLDEKNSSDDFRYQCKLLIMLVNEHKDDMEDFLKSGAKNLCYIYQTLPKELYSLIRVIVRSQEYNDDKEFIADSFLTSFARDVVCEVN